MKSAAVVFAWLHSALSGTQLSEYSWTTFWLIQSVPWVSDPVRHPLPSSLSVPRGKRGKITQPQLTTGLSWCSFKQASPHTMNIQGQQVDHPRSVKARFKPPCKQDITLEQDTESPAALGVLSSISTRPLTSLWSRRGQNILGKIWKNHDFFYLKKTIFN